MAADAAFRSGKQRQLLHQHVAAVEGRGWPGMNTSGDDLDVKGNPGDDTGGCDPEVASNGKGDPEGRG